MPPSLHPDAAASRRFWRCACRGRCYPFLLLFLFLCLFLFLFRPLVTATVADAVISSAQISTSCNHG